MFGLPSARRQVARKSNAASSPGPTARKGIGFWNVVDALGGPLFAGVRREFSEGRGEELMLNVAGGPVGGPLLVGARRTAKAIGDNFGTIAAVAAVGVVGVVGAVLLLRDRK